jgi:PKD repeat protein
MSADYDSIACDDYYSNSGGNGDEPSFCDPNSQDYDQEACEDYHSDSGGIDQEPGFCDPMSADYDSIACDDYHANYGGGHYESCHAGFGFDFERDNGMMIHFYNHSHSNNDFISQWTFTALPSDGLFQDPGATLTEITSIDRDPSIAFSDTGFVNVMLTIISMDTSCSDTVYFDSIYVPGESFDSHGECQFGANIDAEPDTNAQRAGYFSINSSGVVAAVRWDFNDGSSIVESMEAYHQFPHDGYFNVCAFVTDTSGCEIETCMPINIGEGEGSSNCFADFYFEEDSTYGFTFVNTSQGDYSNLELWIDGPNGGQHYSNLDTVSHIFTAPGYWNVCMNVWNDQTGCQSNNCITVAVEDTASNAVTCYADYSYSLDLETNTVTFNNKSQGNNIEYHWEFGDGGISDEENPVYNYADKGFYHVGLSVIIKDGQGNPQCHSHYENLVKLIDENTSACFADFGFWTDGLTLHVNDNSQGNISSYYYNFAGIGDADSAMASFTFPENGFYEVCLTVIDKDQDGNINCQADVCHGIQIGEGGCFAEFTSFVDSLTVSFTNESDGEFNQVFWQFEDQGSSNEYNPTFIFDEPGFYEVTMTISEQDEAGNQTGNCNNSVTKLIQVGEVSQGGACYADFNFFIEDTLMAFNNQSQGNFTEAFWTFIDHNNGEQFTSDEMNPVLGAPGPGFYEACITIIDKDENGDVHCQADFCQSIEIRDENGESAGCFPEFSFFIDSLTVSFNNESNGAFNKAYWSFADQGSSEEMNPIFTFNEYGFYEVCLFIADENIDPNQPGCHGMEVCHHLQVMPEGDIDGFDNMCYADFSYFVEPIGDNLFTVQFNNESKGNFTDVYWNFENPTGETDESNDFSPSGDSVPNGFLHVCLTVFDSVSGCQADYCEGVQIGTIGTDQCFPEFSFRVDENYSVIFNNESEGTYNEQWFEFAGHGVSDEENPEFQFPGPGFYEVCMAIGDSLDRGCHGHVCHPVQIFPEGDDTAVIDFCHAEFNFYVEGNNLQLNNESQGNFTNVYWYWEGNGMSEGSDEFAPFAENVEPGFYHVCLTVFDTISGCQSEVCHPIQIGDVSNDCFAEFTYLVSDGNTVEFNNESEGAVSEFYWHFAGLGISNQENPEFQFPGPGFYEVCMGIYDAESNCGADVCHPVEIFDTSGTIISCFADFTAVVEGLTVKVDDDSRGDFTEYYWNMDGFGSLNGESGEFTFEEPGFYHICLTVFDEVSGCAAEHCRTIEIKGQEGESNNLCRADFTFFVDGNTVNVNNESQGVISEYNWNFNDEGFASSANETFTFEGPGFYEVCLGVRDTISDCHSRHCEWIEIFDTSDNSDVVACLADFSIFIDRQAKEVVFNNESRGDISRYFWDFGDGAISFDENPVHAYIDGGYYDVKLVVFDEVSGCQSEMFQAIELIGEQEEACLADFDFYVDIETKTAYFTNESKGNYSMVNWRFGDGGYANDEDPSHTYEEDGYYEVALTVFDLASGCQSEMWLPVEVIDTNAADEVCLADFTFFPDLAGNELHVTNESKGEITKYFWQLSNGAISFDENPTFEVASDGYYELCLTVMNTNSGCQSEICEGVEFIDTNSLETLCKADFNFYADAATGKVFLTNESEGTFSNMNWNFGDGNFSNSMEDDIEHTYGVQGIYPVRLTVFDIESECHAEVEKVVEVLDTNATACFVDFSMMPDLETRNVDFTNQSIGDFDKYFWDLGDGNFSEEENPSHEYADYGYYHVCLTVFDEFTQCQAYFCNVVELVDTNSVDCFADFDFFANLETKEVNFINNSIGEFDNYHWNLGDGNFSDDRDPDHTYADFGYYGVSLTVFHAASQCQAFVHMPVEVIDTNTVTCFANFSFFPGEDNNVEFSNESEGSFEEFFWIFGDGGISKEEHPGHMYNESGIYEVTLNVFDPTSGCHSVNTEMIEVIDTNEVYCNAYFTFYPDSTGDVVFTADAQGDYTDLFWDLGDYSYGTDTNLTHTYGEHGFYPVSLTVFDEESGCIHTYTEEVVAGTADAIVENCQAKFEYYPAGNSVTLTNKSIGNYSVVFWELGDGNDSEIDSNFTHTYETGGYYDVTVTVVDTTTNCFDSYNEVVTILDTNADASDNCAAFFSYFPLGDSIAFADESYGDATQWYWNFGDNTNADTSENPSHSYAKDGYYEVCLTSTNAGGCQETYCMVIAVGDVSNSCYANYNYFADDEDAFAKFNNLSLGEGLTYFWDFGDDVYSEQEHPGHSYADTGYYAVCLEVSNDSGCADVYCNDVMIGNVLADRCLFSCVWPGDANNDLEANHYDILSIGLNFGSEGPARDTTAINWVGHSATEWSTFQADSTNNMHADCNGDGVVNFDDTLAIESNFAFSHFKQFKTSAEGTELSMVLNGDIEPGAAVSIDVIAGDDIVPLQMYGIGFELGFADGDIEYSTLNVDYDESWLGAKNDDMIAFDTYDEAKDLVFSSSSRIDQVDAEGAGILATVTFNIAADFAADSFAVSIFSNGGVQATGDDVEFSNETVVTAVAEHSVFDAFEIKPIDVYPNPTSGSVRFNLPLNENFNVEVTNLMGQVVYSSINVQGGLVDINLSELAAGMYTMNVRGTDVQYTSKIQVAK